MTDEEKLNAFLENAMKQYSVDSLKKPSLTLVLWLQFIYAGLNALHDTGVMPDIETPDIFAESVQWLAANGYDDFANLWNTQEGEGDFDSWPLTYHVPA